MLLRCNGESHCRPRIAPPSPIRGFFCAVLDSQVVQVLRPRMPSC